MAKAYVAFLLDFFQPAAQHYDVVEQVAHECYRPLAQLFKAHVNARFTVSLSNSLADLLLEYGCADVIAQLRAGVESGNVELAHTGAYHPIFPLLPEPEVRRQINLDIESKSQHFGGIPRSGICSPEMCYDDTLLSLYRELGFKWTVIDDCVAGLNGIRVPSSEVVHVCGFAVFMRSSLWSEKVRGVLKGREFVQQLESEVARQDIDCYKLISLSAETFGHHIKYYEETFIRDMLFTLEKCESVCLCRVSDLLERFPQTNQPREESREFHYLPPSSWATQPPDYQRGDPYPHWKSRGNAVHQGLWELTGLILDACRTIDFENRAHSSLRQLLDQAFYSTQYYWGSFWFWNSARVFEGLDLQMRALYRCADLTRNSQLLEEGARIYANLMRGIEKEDQWRRSGGHL